MAKVATEPAISVGDFGLGERIFDGPNEQIIEGQNYTWTLAGSTVLQHAFRPLFKTTSTTYTKATGETSYYAEDLQPFWGAQIQLRRTEGSGNARNLIGLRVYGRSITVKLTIRAHAGGSPVTLEVSCGYTWEEASDTLAIDPATYTYSGSDDIYCYLEARAAPTVTGYLSAVSVTEAVASVGDMPRGR